MQHEGDKNLLSERTHFLFFVSPLAVIHCFLPIYKNNIQAVKKYPNDVKELKIDTLQHADNNQVADILTFDGPLWMRVFTVQININIFIKF